ncbi:unnamed protein product [Adineta ricciae]|uniref:Uncharacterized protein n=1 Tax=Adineta ricciae TaxID=249248 RepID=A0A816CQ17_ADIRI|nr:unnamed protein product [Adineta ricciae]
MLRLVLFGSLFIVFSHEQALNSARDFYGQSSNRIRISEANKTLLNLREYAKQQYKASRARDSSPTFIQSRRFHSDQVVRDYREHGRLFPPQTEFSPSISYLYTGLGSSASVAASQEGCRLTNNYCSKDYQCCSGKCRCVRWSVMGKMSCYKKCF